MSAALEEELRDFVMAIVDGGIESMTFRGDTFLGEVWIGTMVEEKLNDFDLAAGGGIFQRAS